MEYIILIFLYWHGACEQRGCQGCMREKECSVILEFLNLLLKPKG